MKPIFTEIYKKIKNVPCKNLKLKNKKLTTTIFNYYEAYNKDLSELTTSFNNIFDNKSSKNCIKAIIIQNNNMFEKLNNYLSNTKLYETTAIQNFNDATKASSIAKCSKNGNYIIMKCYDYFFYLFDKEKKENIMVVTENKKAITMINILLLTPYLMFGELNAIHGGLVNKNNQNILINNSSLGGKTTFAILFAEDGWNIVTEENTYISKNGVILPYNIRNYFNIRVGTYLAFEDFFKNKGIVHSPFIEMKGKSSEELFEQGKEKQLSVPFKELGSNFTLNKQKITHSLKVSILKNSKLIISEIPTESLADSFVELSTSPTVQIFQELLTTNPETLIKRKKNLNKVLKNVKAFNIQTGLNYKKKLNYIKDKINVN